MEQLSPFESYTMSRRDGEEWSKMLEEMHALVEQSKIKVVDIRRDKDQLTIIFRRLS